MATMPEMIMKMARLPVRDAAHAVAQMEMKARALGGTVILYIVTSGQGTRLVEEVETDNWAFHVWKPRLAMIVGY